MKRIQPSSISESKEWDFIIIGGGATGLGTALDAANRGFKTLLIEQADFAKGTSSRSTKLVHGGVRYLAQGDIKLVRHALMERGLLQINASHLVDKEAFIIPCYSWFSLLKYLIGLTLYDWLSGKYSFGKSKWLSKNETLKAMPGIKSKGLKGGIRYFDGKFDDARLAINLAQTAIENGATLANYTKAIKLLKFGDQVTGVEVEDVITKQRAKHYAKVIINATGVFVDDILHLNNPNARKMVRPSQGVHLVLDKHFLNSESALMIPKTSDGRVLFAVPWHQHVLVGTTDTPLDAHDLEPRALEEEVDFIINTAGDYFKNKPDRSDILSVFSGLRPLAAPTKEGSNSTKEISRDHKLMVSAKGLITITGGKWTTYRLMAEETVNLAIFHAHLPKKPCNTQNLKIHGCISPTGIDFLNIYGTDKTAIENLAKENADWAMRLHPKFKHIAAEVIWATQHEMAETVEDILSRRLRILFIDARAAKEMAPKVAQLMAQIANFDQAWIDDQINQFNQLADGYIYATMHKNQI